MESIKDHIKSLARDHSKKMGDLADALEITSQGMYKAFREGSISLKQLEKIAEFIGVYVTELLPTMPPGEINTNTAGNKVETYRTRVDGNNFLGSENKDYLVLKSENEHLKETVTRLEKEVEFLRDLLRKK